ncbi:2946_t:CDS:2, partial [Gigaspora margarita]
DNCFPYSSALHKTVAGHVSNILQTDIQCATEDLASPLSEQQIMPQANPDLMQVDPTDQTGVPMKSDFPHLSLLLSNPVSLNKNNLDPVPSSPDIIPDLNSHFYIA